MRSIIGNGPGNAAIKLSSLVDVLKPLCSICPTSKPNSKILNWQ